MNSEPPTAERRLVSVLFADLVGFTPFAEGRDPEEVRETLSRYFEVARDVIARYGGTVEKFIGDAVMAVWGAPIAHEDDAERAVRAGLELLDAVRSVGPEIVARAGILTGEAAVTVGATNQGMVAGDLVNTAARLQSVAAPGSVLVDHATFSAASRAIAFQPAGEHALKGKAAPFPAWLAVRVVAEVGGRNRADTLEPPFVGRENELRLLKDLFHATSREGRARLVSISAPAGLGKSRLAWEFSKYIDGLIEPVWWHAGRSPAYGEGITFWALGEMVRARAGLAETDNEATTRERIDATLLEWVTDPGERQWIASALFALLGVETAAIDPQQLFGAWRTFFERVAAQGTVVLLFEDLHWADTGLLDFIDNLIEWSKDAPIYVVALARPELLDRRPDWPAGRRNFSSVALEPLADPQMRELLAGVVPGLPERAVRSIVARAEGIPLYAVETVRMLVADRRLIASDGVYRPTGDLAELAIPDTLTALIGARLDGLQPAERGLVADGAVLGHSFTAAGVAAVSGRNVADLESGLRSLVRHEILTVEADPRSPERGQYMFVQALIREVAYNTLARRDRRSRHLTAARHFESLNSDELAGALAGHYLAAHAHSTAGPEADVVAVQARLTLRAAAERAATLGAHLQAVAFIEQALSVTHEPADRADLLERAGESVSDAGQHDRADGYLRDALAIRRELGDRSAIAHVIAILGSRLLSGFRIDTALKLLEPAVSEFVDLVGDKAVIELGAQLARSYAISAQPERAIEWADRVLVAAERLELLPIVAEVLITKGGSLADAGRSYEGIGTLQTGLAIAEANDLPKTAMRALINLAATQTSRDPAAAVEASRRGLSEAQRLSLPSLIVALVGNGAEAALWTGEWDWAIAEADAVLRTDLDDTDRGFLLTAAIPIRCWRGEPVDAELTELQRLSTAISDPDGLSTLHAARSHIALAAGPLGYAHTEALQRGALSPTNAPSAYPVAARAALWMGDAEGVHAALAALEATGSHGPPIGIHRRAIYAVLRALEGRSVEA
ncbi:MAG: AAA family ATPase, partial [Candidatus Limnocylindria bacterium]